MEMEETREKAKPADEVKENRPEQKLTPKAKMTISKIDKKDSPTRSGTFKEEEGKAPNRQTSFRKDTATSIDRETIRIPKSERKILLTIGERPKNQEEEKAKTRMKEKRRFSIL